MHLLLLICCSASLLYCRYGARFVDEYITATVGGDVFNVGEFWTDLNWNGCELEGCQDAARQVGRYFWCHVTCYVTKQYLALVGPELERLQAGGLSGRCTPGGGNAVTCMPVM
jgi:hypothetical protein